MTLSARREALLVVAACAVLFWTGLGDVPFYTRGEPREGLVVREMLRSGRWLVPSRPDGELARKPPLYYWLAAGLQAALPGREELLLRLPSAVLGTAGVLATWAAARTAIGSAAGLPAALVLASSFEWTRAATQARVDMALAAPLAGVLAGWMCLLSGASGRRRALLLAGVTAALAAAVLAKGPVGLILPGLAVAGLAAVCRDPGVLRRVAALPTLAVAAALAALWYGAAFAEHGRAFLEVVARENWLRFVDAEDSGTGHGGKGVLYLPAVGLLGLLPWVPVLPLAFRRPHTPATMLAAVWAIAVVGFFALADAQRSVYLLPAFPAVAVLIGGGLTAVPLAPGRWSRPLRALTALWPVGFAVLAGATAAVASGLLDVARLLPRGLTARDAASAAAVVDAAATGRGALLALAAVTVLAILPLARLRRSGRWREMLFAVAALTSVWVAAFQGLLHPAIGSRQSLRDFMVAVDRRIPADAVLYAVFPPDPGLRFYAPRPLRPIADGDAARERWLLVWEDEHRRWRTAGGAELPTVLASQARPSRRGRLLLVGAPPGPLLRRDPGPGPGRLLP